MKADEPCDYSHLPSSEEEKLLETQDCHRNNSIGRIPYCGFLLLLFLLLSSIVLNFTLMLNQYERPRAPSDECISTYANLPRSTVLRRIHPHDEYVNVTNLTATSLAWDKLSGDSGVVALTDEYVAAMNLPAGIKYPWDKSKGVYLLQSYHNLHCLRIVYRSITEYHLGLPQKNAFEHILHCLDELRQDVICNADDTPRYAAVNPAGTGAGQVRKCRDWYALEQWAREHTACFHHEDGVPNRMVNRFKTCPDGSQPWINKEPV